MDSACVIGWGVVGQATGNVFGIKARYDTDETKSTISISDIANYRFVFICLPTPVDDNGEYHTQSIVDIIKEVEKYGHNCLYIIRSTVYPGLARDIMDTLGIDRVVSNPEFLSEATAEKDTKFPPFILLGGTNPKYLGEIKGFYEGRIKGAPVILTDNVTAELAKLSLNAFFATKVIYANTIFDVARKIGANYEIIRRVFENHPYGPRNHFQVWYRGKRGVHGHCLPKDLRALKYYTDAELISKVNELNDKYKDLKEE